MIELEFRVKWLDSTKEWRVYGSGDQYWTAKKTDDIPKAVRGMLRYEADRIDEVGQEEAP